MTDPLDDAIFGGPEPAQDRPAEPSRRTRRTKTPRRTGRKLVVLLLALALARIARNAWLPENDLANIALTTGANGAAIGALYIAVIEQGHQPELFHCVPHVQSGEPCHLYRSLPWLLPRDAA